jgi:deoxyribodipyrimidine photo-lyase
VFLTETLSDLATRRPVEIWLGSPQQVLADRALAVTFTPVPGWHRRSAVLQVVSLHPWPWLIRPLSCAPERSVRGPESSVDEAR